MRLKPIIIWVLVLAAAFALGFFITRSVLHGGDAAIQDQNAPQAPSK